MTDKEIHEAPVPIREVVTANGFAQRYSNILQTLVVIGISVTGMWTGVIYPLQQRIDRMYEESHNLLTVREYAVRHEELKLRVDQVKDDLQKQIDNVRSDVAYLRNNEVTRQEHITHWDGIKEANMDLRAQVDSLRKDFGGQYTVSEKLKDLQHQLDQLQVNTIQRPH